MESGQWITEANEIRRNWPRKEWRHRGGSFKFRSFNFFNFRAECRAVSDVSSLRLSKRIRLEELLPYFFVLLLETGLKRLFFASLRGMQSIT